MKKKLTKFDKKSVSRAYALLTTLAVNLIVIIVGMFLLGIYLDKKFETAPIFMFICLVLGVGAAFRNLYILSMRSMPKPKEKYEYKKWEDKDDDESDF